MIWLVWRRQRTALLLLATLTPLAVAALCWIRLASAARFGARGVPDACFAEGTPQCRMLAQQLLTRDDAFGGLWGLGHSFLLVLPLLLGLIAGAGLFSRDIENGTSVFVLAQGTSWQRWWVSGLLVTGLPALVAAAVIGALTRWAFSPLDLITYPFSLLETPVFEISGLAPVGYALLAFCVAAASGILTRSALGDRDCGARLRRRHDRPRDRAATHLPVTGDVADQQRGRHGRRLRAPPGCPQLILGRVFPLREQHPVPASLAPLAVPAHRVRDPRRRRRTRGSSGFDADPQLDSCVRLGGPA
jgi:hypothetical protein